MMRPADPLNARAAVPVVSVALAVKIVLLLLLALNTRFVMDEFWQFGQAKYLGNGLFDTIWPGKAVGYAVFYKLAHWVGWDAQSMLLAGRLQTALLGCATLAIVYCLARRLGEDRVRAALIVLLLLSFSTFMERVFRTRSEPLALFFGAAALLTAVRGEPDAWRRLVAAGVLSGLAFLSTQKAVYFNLALGLALLADAAASRQYFNGVRQGALLVAGWVLPILLYCVVFGGGEPIAVAVNLITGPIEVATTGQNYYDGLWRFVLQTLLRNGILYLVGFLGMGVALFNIGRLERRARIALVFTLVVTFLIFAHNQPWPYVFIMALPFIALWLLRPLDAIPSCRNLVFVALALAVAAGFWRSVRYLNHDNGDQLAVITAAEALLGPNDIYFDGVGMLPNRVESSYVWLDARGVFMTNRDGTASELYTAMKANPPKALILNYRTDAVGAVNAPLIAGRYVLVVPNILLAGTAIEPGVETAFDAPVGTSYRLYDDAGRAVAAMVRVDGVARELPIFLEKGRHDIRAEGAAGRLFLLPDGLPGGHSLPATGRLTLFADIYTY